MTPKNATLAADAPAPGRPFQAGSGPGSPTLAVIVYHYVRRPGRSRFPGIKGLSTDAFRDQVQALGERYEMATLESALAFLSGRYRPKRSLCLLTFDDGLRDHYAEVMPILNAHRLQGIFFVISGCLAGNVAAVHMNHHLMSVVEFATYRQAFMDRVVEYDPATTLNVDMTKAEKAYPWDSEDVAAFKYLLNYQLPPDRVERALTSLFARFIGDPREFAKELYITWDEAREMQREGMVIGGHSHAHRPLSCLNDLAQGRDLATCTGQLWTKLLAQPVWPFSYPYGYFDAATIEILQRLGFACSFALEGGDNEAYQHAFRIRRIDTKDLVFV